MSELQVPSLYYLRCPKCGASELRLLGEKGALGKSLAIGAAFGSIGLMVAASDASSKPIVTEALKYKCKQCKNKFVTYPLPAKEDELLATPCKVTFTRVFSMFGMAVPQILYINGMKVGPIKNGQSHTFETAIKYNTLHVTDANGVAFADEYNFEAADGGEVIAKFKRKFIR